MRKWTNTILLTFLICSMAFAIPEKIQNDILQIGQSATTAVKQLIFDVGDGATNPAITVDATDKEFVLNKKTTVQGDIVLGDGTTVDRKVEIDRGGSNPFLKWDETAGAWIFSNDGTLEKKIGSGSGGASGGVNLLLNASFEDPGSPILNWSNTGGTLTQEEYTNATEDNLKYARFVTTTLTDKLESDLVIKPDFFEIGGMADIWYKSTEAFHISVVTNTGTVSSTATVSASADWQKAPTSTFAWDVDGKIVIEPLVASSTIELDTAYLGSNKGFIPETIVNERHDIEWRTANGTGNTSVGSYHQYGILFGTSEYTKNDGDVITIDTQEDITRFYCKSAFLYCEVTMHVGLTNTANFRITREDGLDIAQGNYDGTGWPKQVNAANSKIPSGTYFYVQTTSNVVNADAGFFVLTAKGVRKENNPSFSPEQANFYSEAIIEKGSGAGYISLSAGSDILQTVSNTAMTLNYVSKTMQQACDGAESTGVDCAGLENIGFSEYLPRAGTYEVCFQGVMTGSCGAGCNVEANWYWVETENDSNTVKQVGTTRMNIIGGGSSGGVSFLENGPLCQRFPISSVGKKTFKIKTNATIVGGSFSFKLEGGTGASRTDHRGKYSIKLVEHDVSAPRIINQVSTRSKSGAELGSCIVYNESGTASFDTNDDNCWFLDAVNRISTGTVTVTTTRTGLKCTSNALEGNRTVGFVDATTGLRLQVLSNYGGVMPSEFRVQIRNEVATAYDESFILSCFGNR